MKWFNPHNTIHVLGSVANWWLAKRNSFMLIPALPGKNWVALQKVPSLRHPSFKPRVLMRKSKSSCRISKCFLAEKHPGEKTTTLLLLLLGFHWNVGVAWYINVCQCEGPEREVSEDKTTCQEEEDLILVVGSYSVLNIAATFFERDSFLLENCFFSSCQANQLLKQPTADFFQPFLGWAKDRYSSCTSWPDHSDACMDLEHSYERMTNLNSDGFHLQSQCFNHLYKLYACLFYRGLRRYIYTYNI